QSGAPVCAFSAYIVPWPGARLQPKITPLAPLTAPSARLPCGSLVVHKTSPVFADSAAQPPAVVVVPSFNVHGNAPTPPPADEGPLFDAATKIFCPSVDEPHCKPPVTPPGATCVDHASLPSLARNAQNMPLFCPAPTRPISLGLLVSENSIGPCAKSQS